jgi:hypothetical protein
LTAAITAAAIQAESRKRFIWDGFYHLGCCAPKGLVLGNVKVYTLSMRIRFALVPFALVLCVIPAARADVTLRYTSDVQFASFLPSEVLDTFQKSMKGNLTGGSQTIRMKGNKGYTSAGKVLFIVDFDKQELTMMDGENKRVAVLPAGQYSERLVASMPKMPDEARKAFDSMKVSFDSHRTGRTDVIQGVQAEEREAVLAIEMPVPGGDQMMPMMKMVMQIWTAKPEEALRVQAIRELTGYNLWTSYFMNPAESLGKMFGAMPGLGKGMTAMFEEMSKNKAVMLRTQMSVYSSFFGQLAQKMQKEGKPLPASFDPDAPIVQMKQEAEELSTAPIEDSIFQIPQGYATAPMEDLMKTLVQPKL